MIFVDPLAAYRRESVGEVSMRVSAKKLRRVSAVVLYQHCIDGRNIGLEFVAGPELADDAIGFALRACAAVLLID